jgi:hypothetical protein
MRMYVWLKGKYEHESIISTTFWHAALRGKYSEEKDSTFGDSAIKMPMSTYELHISRGLATIQLHTYNLIRWIGHTPRHNRNSSVPYTFKFETKLHFSFAPCV